MMWPKTRTQCAFWLAHNYLDRGIPVPDKVVMPDEAFKLLREAFVEKSDRIIVYGVVFCPGVPPCG